MKMSQQDIARRTETRMAYEGEPIGGIGFFRGLGIGVSIGLVLWIVLIGVAAGTIGLVLELLK